MENILDYSFMHQITNNVIKDLVAKKDQLIKDRLISLNVDVNDFLFLKENLTILIKDGDPFEHYILYLGGENETRVISFSKQPLEQKIDEPFKFTVAINYY